MHKLLSFIAVCLATFAVIAIPTESASAQGGAVSVQSTSLQVWPGDCDYVDYSVTVIADWAEWDAEVRITKPGGGIAGTDYIYDGSTTGELFLCDYDRRGTYKISVNATGYDDDYDQVGTATATTTFTFSVRPLQQTHLALSTHHVRHGYWEFSGTLTKQGQPYANRRVTAQFKVNGSWYRAKTKTTNRAGVVHFNARPDAGARKYQVRLYFAGSDHVKSAASRAFRLYP